MSDKDRAYEVMAECMNAEDGFARFNEIVFPTPLHTGQEMFARNASQKINMLCPGNSWGKTEYLTRRHLYKCIFKDGMNIPGKDPQVVAHKKRFAEYRTLNCSYNYEIADLVFDRVLGYKNELEFIHWMIAPNGVRRRDREIEFKSGAYLDIGSLEHDGKLIEAKRYYYASIDEVGWVQNFRKILSNVILPRLIVPFTENGGTLDLFGTPKEITDPEVFMMFEKGMRHSKGYYSQEGSTYENTFLPEEQIRLLEDQYKDNPAALRQVIYGEFVKAGGTVFRADAIRRIFWPELHYPAPYEEGHLYISVWDYARKQDHTVGTTLDISRKPYKVVNFIRVPKSDADWQYIYHLGKKESVDYHVKAFVIDRTGMGGDVIEDRLAEMGLPVVGVDFGGAQGTKKVNIVQALVDLLDEPVTIDEDEAAQLSHHLDHTALARGAYVVKGGIKSPPIDQLAKELTYYAWDDKKLETDCVMSLAMAAYYLRENFTPPPTYEDVLGTLIRK
ncbi:MAG: hypothetical protein WC072_06115 [Methanoregulaceae archaeon]